MEKRKLGSAGLEVAAIGLGCMGMSQSYGAEDERVDSESIKVIHEAIELGVDFFDTAEVYGPYTNEELLGRALKGKRDKAVIATKFGFDLSGKPPYETNSKPSHIKQVCEQSLKRLGIDVIDLWYQHRVDQNVPIEETVGAMAEMVEQGKVRFLGLSEAGPETIKRAHRVHPISALQSEYSLWERGLEENIIPLLEQLEIGLVPFSPVGRGFLTGEIKSFEDLPKNDFRRKDPRYQGDNFKKNMELVEVVKEVATKHGVTPAQIAIAWTLHQGKSIVPIPGTKRFSYLRDNCAAAKLKLDRDDLQALDRLAQNTSGPRYEPDLMAKVER